MAVPRQIQKQSEAVQQLYRDLGDEPNASPEGEASAIVTEVPTPADSVSEPASAPSSPEPDDGSQEETFEQKYRTLQGMYNADVPRLNAQNQELSGRTAQLEQLISTMQAVPAVPATSPAAEPAPPPVSKLTAEEVEEYGESIDIMRKVSQEVATAYEQQIAELRSTVHHLQGAVLPRVEEISNKQAHTAEQAFWSELSRVIPDWRKINENQDFQSWLLETDPLSGFTRQTYLEDAQRNLDAVRVASFFTSWNSAGGTVTAHPSRTAPASELERQVSPGRKRSSGTRPSAEAKTYTHQDIAKFFDEVRRGLYHGKEEERNGIESDIFAAQREGRIINA